MNNHKKVIVAGGGISGLTIAYFLNQNGCDVTVLESDKMAGGTMKTLSRDGWLIEGGPNSALETTPLFSQIFSDLGLSGEVNYASELSNKRYIYRNGSLHPVPMSPVAFIKSRLWSTKVKLRLLKEPFVGRSRREETIAEFVKRRLGREFLDYAINPFVAGVFAGDPERLSVSAAFPKLYALEEKYGGLIKGMILGARERKKRAEKAKDRARQFSFVRGMQTLPDAISRMLGDRLVLNSPVYKIRYNVPSGGKEKPFTVYAGGINQGAEYHADVLVLAIPAYLAAHLVREMNNHLANHLESIYYPPVAEVYLGFKRDQVKQPLDGFGFLIPEKENKKILGTIWSSVLFKSRAPEGHASFTTFVGGSRQPELASLKDNDLKILVLEELRDIMKIEGEPAITYINRWMKAIPQYQPGYKQILDEIDKFENSFPGMILAGNYRGGISVGDCVMSAKRITDQIMNIVNSN